MRNPSWAAEFDCNDRERLGRSRGEAMDWVADHPVIVLTLAGLVLLFLWKIGS